LRAVINWVLRLPPERKPPIAGAEDAWKIAADLQGSFFWNATAPVRMVWGVVRFAGRLISPQRRGDAEEENGK